MKLYIERRGGMIHVQQKVNMRAPRKREVFRTFKSVKDAPANYRDIVRWAGAVGHTLEERP